jgi:hypothetical protein
MTRIRYKEYPCGNHRSNHVFINDGDIGSDYYRARLIPPRGSDKWVVQITNSKEEIINEVNAFTLVGAKIMARGLLLGMGAQLFDEVRRTK